MFQIQDDEIENTDGLNERQQEMYDIISEMIQNMFWEDEPEEIIIRVIAPAGHGKTFVCKIIQRNHRRIDIVFCAPTRQACSVLTRDGCRNVKTIHQLFRAEQTYDENGKTKFVLGECMLEHPRRYVCIVDEGSMVNDDCAFTILETFDYIIVLGDPMQLPPVQNEDTVTDSGKLHGIT